MMVASAFGIDKIECIPLITFIGEGKGIRV
jgi:hypothetical protein